VIHKIECYFSADFHPASPKTPNYRQPAGAKTDYLAIASNLF
jgi:hypothetical protein